MSVVRWLKLGLCIVGVVFVASAVCITAAVWPFVRPARSYRFAISPDAALTEPIALELSQRALAADGRNAAAAHPIPYSQGRDFFAANATRPDSGYVHWATPDGDYGVNLEKLGPEVTCSVSRLK